MTNRQYLKVPTYVGFFSLPFAKYDKPTFEGSVSSEEYIQQNPLNKSGIEGLKRMWTYDSFGSLSKEIETSIHCAAFCGIIGGLYGGFKSGKEAHTRFMNHNLGVKFMGELDAKRHLVDKIALGTFHGTMKLGAKIGFFTLAYMLTANSIAVYRGKSGILDFVVGGAMAGGCYQFWNGPRALLVGVGTGSLLGLVAGSFTLLTMLATGKTYQDVQDWQYGLIQSRDRALRDGKTPDYQTEGENAMLMARKYYHENDMFKESPSS